MQTSCTYKALSLPAGSGAIQESQGEFLDASKYSDHSFIKIWSIYDEVLL